MSDRLEQLEAMLAASEQMGPGYAQRIEAIKREIEKLKRDPEMVDF